MSETPKTAELGEVGEPLPAELLELLAPLATLGWYPFAFGEQGAPDHGEYTEVLLSNDPLPSGANAKSMLQHFIKHPE